MADGYAEIFNSDSFLKMFTSPDTYRSKLKHIANFLLKAYVPSIKKLEDVEVAGIEEHVPSVSVLQQGLKRAVTIMKCLDFGLCLGLTIGSETPSTNLDVLAISAFKGHQSVELNLKDWDWDWCFFVLFFLGFGLS